MFPPYNFQELPERYIRLLHLQAGTPGSPLKGSLRNTSLDDSAVYEALSYTWGSSTTSSFLDCDGSLMSLTVSLEQALSRLRLADNTRVMWIDQICINQSDGVERGRQVSLMGDIYRNAEAVNIWLGEEDGETAMAMRSIRDLLRSFIDPNERDEAGDEVPHVIQKLGILFVKSPNWIALRNIFQRVYFRRMWIIQEVVLGSECLVYCGSYVVPWADLAKAALCLKVDAERPAEALRVVQMIRALKRELVSASNRQFSTLLSQTYNVQCSDPRDKAYGILGLASDIHGQLVPNYHLSCQEVYRAVTKLCIHSQGSLAVLSHVRQPKILSGLPSWVPDWSTATTIGRNFCFNYTECYLAAGTTTSAFRLSGDDDQVLHTQGKRIDVIRKLGPVMTQLDQSKSLESLSEWESICRSVSPYHTGETYPTILWRTLIADGGTRGSGSDRIRQELYESFENLMLRNRLEPLAPWSAIDEMSIVNSRAEQFTGIFEETSLGRRIALTEQGFLALVAPDVQVTDFVCIFHGLHVPFVLRGNPHETHCNLVGECYVQGWMDGSRFENVTSPIEEFTIL